MSVLQPNAMLIRIYEFVLASIDSNGKEVPVLALTKTTSKLHQLLNTTIISWVRRDESSLKSFDVQISVLPRATFLVSNGNNIVARNFARFATIDVKPDTSPLETEPVARDNN